MNAVVTGGTGFFGSALVRGLLARGDLVRALVRSARAARAMRALGAEPMPGDLRALDSCRGLAGEDHVIYHAAARVAFHGRWDTFRRTTIEGTRNLLATVLPSRPRRFVYVSSMCVYTPAEWGRGACADHTTTRPPVYHFYGRAKLEAERLVRRECERMGCPWTIVRLSSVYGPGNRAVIGQFGRYARRNGPVLVGPGENHIATVYVDDAVQATILAATHPIGEAKTYDVSSDEPVTQREFVDALADMLGLPRSSGRVKTRSAFVGAWLIESLCRWLDRDWQISRGLVQSLGTEQVVDAGRIRAELGWQPDVSFAEGMRRARQWYRRLQHEEMVGERNELMTSARATP